jgi:hypothetical protein
VFGLSVSPQLLSTALQRAWEWLNNLFGTTRFRREERKMPQETT